jgi:ribosomal protein S30
MSRKKPTLTKAGKPRQRAPGGGAKPKGNVKMTVHVPPDVREALGSKPGEVITALVRGSNI